MSRPWSIPFGEERRRGATKRAEEIRIENREKEHENTS
jgi:hypothetical protein